MTYKPSKLPLKFEYISLPKYTALHSLDSLSMYTHHSIAIPYLYSKYHCFGLSTFIFIPYLSLSSYELIYRGAARHTSDTSCRTFGILINVRVRGKALGTYSNFR